MISIAMKPGSASGGAPAFRKDIHARHFTEGPAGPDAVASNVFMTFAWYGHLKYRQSLLPLAIMVSWGIALFEYWLAVPANRWGSAVYTAAQLKTMQEVITLIVFAGFSVLYLKEPLGWNQGLGFALIALGAFLIFHKWG
jgi:uncharacterized protein